LADKDPDSHVEKVEVFKGNDKIAFDGIRLRVSTVNLDESAFQILKAGETIEAAFDIAVAHDVSSGGDFVILTEGAFAYAELDSTSIAGAVPFVSNKISAAVDGAQAGKIRRDYIALAKRTVVQSDCTGTRRTATTTALSNCASLARTAASAAVNNAAKLNEYFKSTSSSTASTVQTVFNRVATQCGSTTSGNSRYYCTDILGACSSGVLAYTYPSTSQMVSGIQCAQ
jgi:deuterolysin